jgi:hypothetical protein
MCSGATGLQVTLSAAAEHCPIERIVMLMYAADVVLLSHNPQELAVMLGALDQVAREYGMSDYQCSQD